MANVLTLRGNGGPGLSDMNLGELAQRYQDAVSQAAKAREYVVNWEHKVEEHDADAALFLAELKKRVQKL